MGPLRLILRSKLSSHHEQSEREPVPAANVWPESCGMGLGSVGEAGMETSREGPRNRLIQRKNSGWVCFDERSRLWAYTRRDRMEVD